MDRIYVNVSYLAMAIEGVLYAPYYRFKLIHIVIAGIWTIHNDIIDYLFLMYPRYTIIGDYLPQIGYFTFWLSVVCIGLAYYYGILTTENNYIKRKEF